MYRALNSRMVLETLQRLSRRIEERFPDSSLRKVCVELVWLAEGCDGRTARLEAPNFGLRALVVLVLAAGAGLFCVAASHLNLQTGSESVFGVIQGIDAGMNLLILMGASVVFLVTLENRLKRGRAMADLNELRSVIHVIDMHQLTKDPAGFGERYEATASSPKRTLAPHELVRYLDYCSELLSLAAKLSALYAQSSKDPVVIDASSDLQQITANLSAKIWQKITIAQNAR